MKGAATALGMGALGMAAAHVPGGDALLATVTEAASAFPWKEPPPAEGAAEAGGGAGGASTDETAAKKAGAGHRNHIVKGPMTETIGALHAVMTPGTIGWQTTGISTILVGASHITKATATAVKTLGASKEVLGALHVKSNGDVSRDVTRALKTTVAGALKTKSDGRHNIKAGGKLTITVKGDLKMTGSHVTFVCGDDTFVSASPGGVLIEAKNVTITGNSKQSSKTTHK